LPPARLPGGTVSRPRGRQFLDQLPNVPQHRGLERCHIPP
jgi:hypothetical protein